MSLFLTPGSFFGVQAWQVQVLHACRVQPSKKVQLDAFSEFLGDALTFFYLLTLFPKLPFSDDWIFSPTAHIGGQSLIGTAFLLLLVVFFFGCTTGNMGSQLPNRGSNPCPLHWNHRDRHWIAREVPGAAFLNCHCTVLAFSQVDPHFYLHPGTFVAGLIK